MGKREELEAALAKAEAELARAVVGRGGVAADVVEADTNIEKARTHCRHACAALAESNRERSTQSSEPQVADVETPSGEQSRARKSIQELVSSFSAQALDAPDWRLLARRSVMLLALVLAYFQYYFLDVQLQVVRLPTITVLLFS